MIPSSISTLGITLSSFNHIIKICLPGGTTMGIPLITL